MAESALAGAPALRAARIIGPIAVGIALLSALVTFAVLSNLTPIAPTNEVVRALLMFTALTAVLLIGLIGREIWQIVQSRRRGRAASRLHVRIVALFSLVTAVPAILVAVVASVTLDRGLDRQFSQRTRSVIQNSLAVSQAYLSEHVQSIRGDIMAMAIDVGRAKTLFDQERERFRQFFTAQATFRGLPSAELLQGDSTSIEKANIKAQTGIRTPSPAALASAGDQEPQIALSPDGSYVGAVIKLRGYENTYLYVTRTLDPRVVAQLAETQAGVSEYANLEARRLGVQVAFALMYTVIALTVLLSAVWVGLNFANRLVAPIRRLIGAAQIVSTGNLHVQVPIRASEGDLGQLGETFNKMTRDLRTQRDDIVNARDLIDSRRRFTEAVLSGASAGVIGVDPEERISILNRSAERLIGRSQDEVLGRKLAEVVPELADIIAAAQSGVQKLVQGQISINRQGRERNLSVRVTSEQTIESEHGYVVTLDDITELILAQRSSAWADIARRIAHEIKNPLTPIQLSAERLRRKYGKTITEDPAVFEQCTATIIRQVDDIKRMVDEFSRFARMPKPVIAREDLADTVRQAVFLMKVGNADIEINTEIAEDPMLARFDRRLISQALTNIVKNATEAIAALPAEPGRGRIRIIVAREPDRIVIDVVDNGIGLPTENRNRLLEPYVTTREKGTGLGLAIVGRILEEHGGGIELNDAADIVPGQRGAWMRLWFAENLAPAESVDRATPVSVK
jgi:two-component system nitrogen regulation sensor histidine kinase NtrY